MFGCVVEKKNLLLLLIAGQKRNHFYDREINFRSGKR